jgi:hypothetical protein
VLARDLQTLVAKVYTWRSKHTRRGVVPLVLALWDEESDRMDKEEKVHVEVHNQRRLREEEMESSQLVSFFGGRFWATVSWLVTSLVCSCST